MEISFEGKEYLVVPQAAILTLVRDGDKGLGLVPEPFFA